MKKWKPIFYLHSKVPVWLSKVSPIEIGALSFGPFVWSRGELTGRLKTHETIHYQQQLELLFVFQWILYVLFWLYGVIKYQSGKKAYYENPFEKEAYAHDNSDTYLGSRRRYSWIKYV
jgi:hypothetical protein